MYKVTKRITTKGIKQTKHIMGKKSAHYNYYYCPGHVAVMKDIVLKALALNVKNSYIGICRSF
jgi:hypothetical protein